MPCCLARRTVTHFRRIACCTLLSLFVIIAAASPAPAAKPDVLAAGVSSWMQQNAVPTAAIAVMRNGQLVQCYGYGGWTPDARNGGGGDNRPAVRERLPA